MTEEMKIKMFEKMLWLEKMAQKQVDGKLYDKRDYWAEQNGAFEMLQILELSSEYIRWSEGK